MAAGVLRRSLIGGGKYRLVVNAILLAGLISLLVGGVAWYRRPAVPDPPEIPPDLDPIVRATIEKSRAQVLASPRAAPAWGRLGMVLVAHDFPDEGIACFAQAERLDTQEPRWPYLLGITLAQRDLDAALPHLRRAVECGGDVPTALRVRLAGVLLERGCLGEAEEQYRRTLQATSDPWAELGLARVLHQRGDWQGSLNHLGNSARSPFTRKASRSLLAEIHERLNDRAAVEDDLRQLAQLPPDLPLSDPFVDELYRTLVGMKSSCARANTLLDLGRSGEALTLLEHTVRDYPQEEFPWLTLGMARARSGNLAGAEEALRTATRLAPQSVESQFSLGLVLFRRFKRAEAAACFRRVVQLKPDSAEGYYNLANCLNRQGDRAGAIEALQAAIRCNPYSVLFLRELIDLLAQNGQQEKVEMYRRRIRELERAETGAVRSR
ncbi:MAG TPA: tetratricopeptide repeat protein [Gemmataceae bacterium]|nr:tetratricopeptide repeat protein [Gemmataceae bacterium]